MTLVGLVLLVVLLLLGSVVLTQIAVDHFPVLGLLVWVATMLATVTLAWAVAWAVKR